MLKKLFKNKTKIAFIFLFIFLFIIGGFYIINTWKISLNEISNQALMVARTAEIGLNGEMLKQLHGDSADISTKAYESIKERLINLLTIDKNIRFAYIYVQKGDKLYFVADSELSDSPNLAPAGLEYTEANDEYYQPIKDGKELITKPSTDRWGTWVSVLIPMKDFETGEVKAVFAFDYPASQWKDKAITNTVQSGIITLILFLLLYVFSRLLKSNLRAKDNEAQLRSYVENAPIGIFICNEKGKYTNVNPAACVITGFSKEELLKLSIPDILPKESQEIAAKLFKEVVETGKASGEFAFKHKNGQVGIWSLEGVKLSPTSFMGITIDITEKNKNEIILKNTLEETARINKLMVGRELEMIKLKEELNELKNKK